MAQAAFGRAIVAAGGTLLALGGATVVVSSASMAVTRMVINRRRKQYLVRCPTCSGRGKVACDVCQEERMLKYHPTKQPPFDPSTRCVCAMCEASGLQVCLNCLGDKEVVGEVAGEVACAKA